jgi:hypothetical protein
LALPFHRTPICAEVTDLIDEREQKAEQQLEDLADN